MKLRNDSMRPEDVTAGGARSNARRPAWRRAVVVLAPAALIAGCGGTSAGHQAAITAPAPSSPSQATNAPVKRTIPVGRDLVVSNLPRARRAQGVLEGPQDESNATGARTVNPCTLVSRSQAQAILGKQVGPPVEAPQGPTCIYKLRGTRNSITLAVESANFSKVKPQSQLRDRISVTIREHRAYCGTLGGPALILPLSGGRSLVVAAPCPLAAGFAATALGHL